MTPAAPLLAGLGSYVVVGHLSGAPITTRMTLVAAKAATALATA